MHDPSLHLFIDDCHVRNLFGLRRTYGSLEKLPEPVLEDIRGRLACWASVLQEPDGCFRMWYQSTSKESAHEMATAGVWGQGDEFGFFPDRYPDAIPETQTSVVSYAESGDGFHWKKPELCLFDWRGSKQNNIVLDGSRASAQFNGTLTNMDTISVIRDDADGDPHKRYKLICHWETVHVWDNHMSKLGRSSEFMQKVWAARAKYLTSSADGIHWDMPLVRIKECAGGGDYAGVTRDERNRRYWFNDRAPVHLSGFDYRAAGLCVSDDLYRWPETVEMAFWPGAYEDYGFRYEHHGMVPFNYGDQDLCFLEYSVGGTPVAGVLGSHRDGQRWQRVNGDAPFLYLGSKGAFDDTIVAATRNAPFRVGDRLLFFYNGRHYDPDKACRTSHIGAATLRLDGFAALTVDRFAVHRHGLPAKLMTSLLEVRREDLQINIADHHATARVGLLREDMRPIPGYEAEACLPIAEDAVRAPVRWRERSSIAELKGQKVHVFLQMATGSVYAVRL